MASHSCVPQTLLGSNNITAGPNFVDYPGGNYRLRSDSPCVNSGTNLAWMAGAVDLDGMRRIAEGTVDMGTYEFTPRGMTIMIR